MITETQLTSLFSELAVLLRSKGFKMATAESCTGGWIAKAATDLSGSSDWFDRGLVTYSNEAKQELLGVSAATIEEYGAVSQQTVEEMVDGLLAINAVSVGVAVSGIAGPGGGSDEKPVGTVWIAWQKKNNNTVSKCYLFKGKREQVRLQAAIAAVSGLIDLLGSD